MRKSILEPSPPSSTQSDSTWLDLDALAQVEVTSEQETFPIEQALVPGPSTGWRASTTGPQVIRLTFDQPQLIKRIHVHIVEQACERSQEFAIYAGLAKDKLHEVRRQQYTFSPGGATEEVEDFTTNLSATILELRIDPDRSHDPKQSRTYATLASLKLA